MLDNNFPKKKLIQYKKYRGVFTFTRTNGTIKNDLIVLKKERNAKNAFLKILEWKGEIGTERNGYYLKRTFKIRHASQKIYIAQSRYYLTLNLKLLSWTPLK